MTDSRHLERPGKLLERLESFEQLHLVLLLAADPGSRWSLAQLTQGNDPDEVGVMVQELIEAGVFVRRPDDLFSLSDDAWVTEGAAALLKSYADNPLHIIQVLTRRSMERLRSAAARTFSEAFVVRRKDS